MRVVKIDRPNRKGQSRPRGVFHNLFVPHGPSKHPARVAKRSAAYLRIRSRYRLRCCERVVDFQIQPSFRLDRFRQNGFEKCGEERRSHLVQYT